MKCNNLTVNLLKTFASVEGEGAKVGVYTKFLICGDGPTVTKEELHGHTSDSDECIVLDVCEYTYATWLPFAEAFFKSLRAVEFVANPMLVLETRGEVELSCIQQLEYVDVYLCYTPGCTLDHNLGMLASSDQVKILLENVLDFKVVMDTAMKVKKSCACPVYILIRYVDRATEIRQTYHHFVELKRKHPIEMYDIRLMLLEHEVAGIQ